MLIFIVGMTSLHCIAPQTTEIQIDDHLLSTPFASIIGKKEYSFSSKNGPKGVLLFPDFQRKRSASLKKKKKRKFKIFKLALLLLQKSSKRSTPFDPKIDQKEYSFSFKNPPEAVLPKQLKEFGPHESFNVNIIIL